MRMMKVNGGKKLQAKINNHGYRMDINGCISIKFTNDG